jgi:hypothetical protein
MRERVESPFPDFPVRNGRDKIVTSPQRVEIVDVEHNGDFNHAADADFRNVLAASG